MPSWWHTTEMRALLKGFRVFFHKVLIVHVLEELHLLPVIHAGPFDFLLADHKAIRPDKMQFRVRGHTGAADISGIQGNARFMQYDLHNIP